MGMLKYPFLRAVPTERGLYAIELSNGLVKVGISGCPRARIKQHVTNFGASGVRITRYAVAPVKQRAFWWVTERELLSRMDTVGTRVKPRRETYREVQFGVAANLVRQIAAREFVSHVPERQLPAIS